MCAIHAGATLGENCGAGKDECLYLRGSVEQERAAL